MHPHYDGTLSSNLSFLTSVSPVLCLTLQLEESQYWLWTYVRGGAHYHQKLPPHQRTDVGARGQIHGRRQAWTAQPFKQVRCQHIYQEGLRPDMLVVKISSESRFEINCFKQLSSGDRHLQDVSAWSCGDVWVYQHLSFVKSSDLQSCRKFSNLALILQGTRILFNRFHCCRYLAALAKNMQFIYLIL